MIDFIPLFAIAFFYALIPRKSKKEKKELKPIIFKTTLQDMIDIDLYIADINKFTAKINSIVQVDKIGFSADGKFYYYNKK